MKTVYDVKILPKAKEDISKAAKWYNIQQTNLGKEEKIYQSFFIHSKYQPHA